MKQFQQMQLLTLVERHNGRDIPSAECGITAGDYVLQVLSRNLLFGDIEGEDVVGEILEGEVFPSCLPVGGESGDLLRDEEAAVVGEAFEHDFFEGELALRIQRELQATAVGTAVQAKAIASAIAGGAGGRTS